MWKDKGIRNPLAKPTSLTDMETLRNIDVPQVSSLLALKIFHTFS